MKKIKIWKKINNNKIKEDAFNDAMAIDMFSDRLWQKRYETNILKFV